jgi:hypothetical protein
MIGVVAALLFAIATGWMWAQPSRGVGADVPQTTPTPPRTRAEPGGEEEQDVTWRPPPAEAMQLPRFRRAQRPAFLPSRLAMRSASEFRAFQELAPPGPLADVQKARELGEDYDWGAAVRARKAIRLRPENDNLESLAFAVADYRLACSIAGEEEVASALMERELFLKGLASDGPIPLEVVRSQACVLSDFERTCELPAWPGCAAAARLDLVADIICSDPAQPLSPDLRWKSSGSTLPMGHPDRSP